MEPIQALQLLDGIIDAVTLVAKAAGIESGLTAGDRMQLKRCVGIIRDALNREPQPEQSQAKKKRN